MPKAKVNGFTMYYEVAGPSTGPWLTFSNSLRLDHTMWWPQVAEFCKDFRVLTYDVRGHGNSTATPGSSYVVIPGATHVSNLTHAKEFNAALRKFLAS